MDAEKAREVVAILRRIEHLLRWLLLVAVIASGVGIEDVAQGLKPHAPAIAAATRP